MRQLHLYGLVCAPMKDQLCVHYRRGFIPGPNETMRSFLQRVEGVSKSCNPVNLESCYGMVPDWISLFYSFKKLLPWEAGCTWIHGDTVQIQLHPKRHKAKHAELLAHEAVHAVRWMFGEPRFEEILAYKTSSNWWRRSLGPLLQKPVEAWFFLLASLADVVQAFLGFFPCCATLLMVTFFGIRLLWNQWRFSACLRNLPDPRLAIGLTDREIVQVAKGTELFKLDDGSLRWEAIKSYAAATNDSR